MPGDGGVVDLAAWRAERDAPADRSAELARAIERVLRRLASRAMTSAEVDRALRDAGLDDPAERDALVRDWGDRGYVDDAAVASVMVERLARRSTGRAAIARRLRERGVSAEEADRALADLDPAAEAQAAVAFAVARADRSSSLPDDALVRRIAGQLQRRGFSSGAQRRALDVLRARTGPDRWAPDDPPAAPR